MCMHPFPHCLTVGAPPSRREGELLAEVAELRAQLRTACSSSAAAPAPLALCAIPFAASAGSQAAAGAAGSDSLQQLGHDDLLLAAAQQLAREADARVDRAERRAQQLEQELQHTAAAAERLRADAAEQAARLEAARGECSSERQAAQELLAANMRLQAAVAALMEQAEAGLCCSHAPSADADCGPCQEAVQEQAPVQGPRAPAAAWGRARPAPAPQAAPKPGGQRAGPRCGSGRQQQPSGHQAARPAAAAQGPVAKARSPAALAAMPPAKAVAPERQLPPQRCQAAADPAALEAAIQAALALCGEHRQLHAQYQAVATELQRVAGDLVAAPPGRQLALLRRHAQLHAELRGVSEQLEDRAVQLAALKRAGVL